MSIVIPNEAQLAYQTVLKGDPKVEWVIFHLSTIDTSLKVQATGSGLDDLEEEFADGRIQYAFARIEEPNSNLEKFVQINWCGDGVPERQKGLFNTWSPQIAAFMKNSHFVIQARNEADVTPARIHKRMQESSGSKYTPGGAPAAAPATPDVIPKVGGAYQKTVVDMASLRAGKDVSTESTPMISAPVSAPTFTKPAPSFTKPAPTFTKPAPSFTKPAVTVPKPEIVSASTPVPSEPSKPAAEDRIAPVGTAYTPVALPKPGKLANRWGANATPVESEPVKATPPPASANPSSKVVGSRFASGGGSSFTGMGGGNFTGAPPVSSSTAANPSPSGKKLTWSERQAEAKKIRDEEEAAAQAAIAKTSGATSPPALARAAPSFGLPASNATPAALPPRTANIVSQDQDEEKEEEDEGWEAPPPPPPMPPADGIAALNSFKKDLTLDPTPASAPPPVPSASRPTPAAPAKVDKGMCAKILYDYEAAEENEVTLEEGGTVIKIEQIDDDWWTGTVESTGLSGMFPSNYVEVIEEEEEAPAAPAPPPMPTATRPIPTPTPAAAPPAPAPAEEEDDVPPPPPPAPPMPDFLLPMGMAGTVGGGVEPEKGATAVAMYDYEAAEDNEISFAEGDEIIQIVETSEDWFTGKNAKTGQEGLFPANYVEMQ